MLLYLQILPLDCITLFYPSFNTSLVMDMEWDYQYYQPWSDDEWLLQELIDNDITMKEGEKYSNESYL